MGNSINVINERHAIVGDSGVLDAADIASRSAGAYRPDNPK